MKHLKKAASLLLVLVLALSLTVPAWADETFSITVNDSSEKRQYVAYQIFTGTVSNDSNILSDVQWGDGISHGESESAASAAEALAAAATSDGNEAAVAAFLEGRDLSNERALTRKSDGSGYVLSGLTPGYYLIKDADGSVAGDDSYTQYIVELTAVSVEVNPKRSTSTVEKKVLDVNDSAENDTPVWQDSADHDIGDDVSFQLTATIPTTEHYDSYYISFTDTLSAGLKYNEDAEVTVMDLSGNTILGPTPVESYFNVVQNDGQVLVFTKNDIKIDEDDIAGKIIVINYTAKLTNSAQTNIGAAGNDNKVVLTYSNNPNVSGDGSTATTPPDTVIVFTYQTVINKVNSSNAPLPGANFILEKFYANEGTWKAIDAVKSGEGDTTFTFTGIDDGNYRIIEETAPDGYNKIDPIYFTVEATHTVESDAPKLETLKVTNIKDANGNDIAAKTDPDTGAVTVGYSFTEDMTNGSLATNIVNNSGAVLPETGGIGTTIFYTVGGILVVGAAILLVTKKRMHNN